LGNRIAPSDQPLIVQRLALQEARPYIASFDRPNIRYRLVGKDGARDQLLRFLRFLHGIVGNWGAAIMLLTLCIRVALLPLPARAAKSVNAASKRPVPTTMP
jgi:membrane protein insertase Oxa1/YidC/SpoIIIJ